MKTDPKERDIKDYFLKRCLERRILTRKVKWENRNGAPDWLMYTNKGIWVELKKPGAKPTAEQADEHKAMRKAGMQVHVIDSYGAVDALMRTI